MPAHWRRWSRGRLTTRTQGRQENRNGQPRAQDKMPVFKAKTPHFSLEDFFDQAIIEIR